MRHAEDHKCSVCHVSCGFGVGIEKPVYYCRQHVPADFFPAGRVKEGHRHSLQADSVSEPSPPKPLPQKAAQVVNPRPTGTHKPSDTMDLF